MNVSFAQVVRPKFKFALFPLTAALMPSSPRSRLASALRTLDLAYSASLTPIKTTYSVYLRLLAVEEIPGTGRPPPASISHKTQHAKRSRIS